jgi:hypothetical protein
VIREPAAIRVSGTYRSRQSGETLILAWSSNHAGGGAVADANQ